MSDDEKALIAEARELGFQAVRDLGVLRNDAHFNAAIWRAVDAALSAALPTPAILDRETLIALAGAQTGPNGEAIAHWSEEKRAGYELGLYEAAEEIFGALSAPTPKEES